MDGREQAQELSRELERDSRGEFKAAYPDKDNHTIDAARYALEDDMGSRRGIVISRTELGL